MGFNFPSSPTIGQLHPATATPGLPQYTWDGVTWILKGTSINPKIIVSDTPPPSPVDGMMWWNGTNGKLFLYYFDGDASFWVQAAASLSDVDQSQLVKRAGDTMAGALLLAGDPANALEAAPKQYVDALAGINLLLNGFADVSQENGGTAVAPAGYAADQWAMQGTAGFVAQSANGGPLYGGGIDKHLALVSPASYSHAAANSAYFVQYIEGLRFSKVGWGTAGGRPISLGLWVYSNAGGVMSVAMRNTAGNRSYVIPLTIPAVTWVYRTATFPPCPDGTWPNDNTAAAQLFISFLPTTGLIAAANNSWQNANVICASNSTQMFTSGAQTGNYITGLTLIPGSTPVPQAMCPLMRRSYHDELLLCQRYWEKIGMTFVATAPPYANTSWYKVTKRISPTITLVSGAANGGAVQSVSYSPLDGLRQTTSATAAVDVGFTVNARM